MHIDPRSLLSGTVSDLTVEAYSICWKQYMEYAGGKRAALKAENLVAWRQHMVTQTQSSRSTINKAIFAVKAIVAALYAQKEVSRDVAWEFRDVTTLPANTLKDRRRPHARTKIGVEEMRAMIDATNDEPCELIRLYQRAFLLTLATTGLRISEATRMRRGDLQARGKFHVIENVMAKAKGEPRDVPIGSEALAAIRDWLAARPNDSEYIWNVTGYGDGMRYSDGPVNRATAADIVRKYAQKVGVEHVKPHDFRRFVGTRLAQKDLRLAQKVLGHASPATTAAHYVLDDVTPGATEGMF